MRKDQETKKDQVNRKTSDLEAAEHDLKTEINEMKNNLEANLKTVDDLMREGIEEVEVEEKDAEPSENQRRSPTWSVQSAWRSRPGEFSPVSGST